jgi:hypothetical protein
MLEFRRKIYRFLAASFLLLICFANLNCGMLWGDVAWNSSTFCSQFSQLILSQLGMAAQITEGTGIAFDPSYNSYTVGYTTGSVLGGSQGTQFGAHGSDDIFVSKFGPTGNLLWVSQLGMAAQTVEGQGIAIDSLGNSYLTGITGGSILGGALGAQYGTHGTWDSFVSKSDTNGNLLWVRQLGLAVVVTGGQAIALDSSGNSYSIGSTGGTVLGGAQGTQFGVHGNDDVFISKMDTNGNLLWVSQLGNGPAPTTEGTGITVDSSYNSYVTGYTTGAGLGGGLGTQYGAHGSDDIFVSKFDPNGNLLWVSQLGLAATQTLGWGMALDSSGNSYVAGEATGTVLGGVQGTQYGTHGNIDIFVSKFNSSGNLLWVSQLGVAGKSTQGYSITIDSSGNTYATGFTTGSVLGGAQGTQYGTHGTDDVFVSKFDTNGNLIWVSQLGVAAKVTWGYGIAFNPCGSLNVTGITSASLGGAQYGTHGTDDIFNISVNSTTGAFP